MGSPFKGMEDRFNDNMRRLYDRYSLKDGTSDSPLQEIKPYDPNRFEKTHDTFMLPIGSTKQDVKRMANFMKTSTGLVFLLKQEIAQAGNTFSQTRIIDPFFVIENAVPFLHTDRSFGKPTSFEVGRLQQHTADAAVARVMGSRPGVSSVLSLFSASGLVGLLQGALNVFKIGVANERPELNVGGNLYAVQLWKGGYQKHVSLSTNLDDAKRSLQSGNIRGAITSVQNSINSVKDLISQGKSAFGGSLNDRLALISGRLTTSHDMDGRRYFITSRDTADTYLTTDASFLRRDPYILPPDTTGMPDVSFKAANPPTVKKPYSLTDLPSSRDIQNIVNTSLGIATAGVTTIGSAITNANIASLVAGAFATFLNESPDATSHMRFSSLAMINRYTNDPRLAFMRDTLDQQKNNARKYWDHTATYMKDHKMATGIDIAGHNPGLPANNDPKVRIPKRRYIHDRKNEKGKAIFGNNALTVTSDTLKEMDAYGRDLIRVHFFDIVNKRVVPFRAFISDINESVKPEFNDTRYIGRIERNVVYVGVNRELSFTLMVQAFSDTEMDAVWQKINYLTGLCYPAGYDHGFMLPPFIKLTIGDFYKDQPGYISGLTHTIDNNSSWEISDNHQVPFGITMNVSFSVIEKKRTTTNTIFYPFGG